MTPGERYRYQTEVERLLEQIRSAARELRRFKAAGIGGRALSDRKRDLDRIRGQLAALIGQPAQLAPRATSPARSARR
jgi:hypothetical protein